MLEVGLLPESASACIGEYHVALKLYAEAELVVQGKEPGKCNSRVEAAAMPKAFALPKRVATDKPGGSKNSL